MTVTHTRTLFSANARTAAFLPLSQSASEPPDTPDPPSKPPTKSRLLFPIHKAAPPTSTAYSAPSEAPRPSDEENECNTEQTEPIENTHESAALPSSSNPHLSRALPTSSTAALSSFGLSSNPARSRSPSALDAAPRADITRKSFQQGSDSDSERLHPFQVRESAEKKAQDAIHQSASMYQSRVPPLTASHYESSISMDENGTLNANMWVAHSNTLERYDEFLSMWRSSASFYSLRFENAEWEADYLSGLADRMGVLMKYALILSSILCAAYSMTNWLSRNYISFFLTSSSCAILLVLHIVFWNKRAALWGYQYTWFLFYFIASTVASLTYFIARTIVIPEVITLIFFGSVSIFRTEHKRFLICSVIVLLFRIVITFFYTSGMVALRNLFYTILLTVTFSILSYFIEVSDRSSFLYEKSEKSIEEQISTDQEKITDILYSIYPKKAVNKLLSDDESGRCAFSSENSIIFFASITSNGSSHLFTKKFSNLIDEEFRRHSIEILKSTGNLHVGVSNHFKAGDTSTAAANAISAATEIMNRMQMFDIIEVQLVIVCGAAYSGFINTHKRTFELCGDAMNEGFQILHSVRKIEGIFVNKKMLDFLTNQIAVVSRPMESCNCFKIDNGLALDLLNAKIQTKRSKSFNKNRKHKISLTNERLSTFSIVSNKTSNELNSLHQTWEVEVMSWLQRKSYHHILSGQSLEVLVVFSLLRFVLFGILFVALLWFYYLSYNTNSRSRIGVVDWHAIPVVILDLYILFSTIKISYALLRMSFEHTDKNQMSFMACEGIISMVLLSSSPLIRHSNIRNVVFCAFIPWLIIYAQIATHLDNSGFVLILSTCLTRVIVPYMLIYISSLKKDQLLARELELRVTLLKQLESMKSYQELSESVVLSFLPPHVYREIKNNNVPKDVLAKDLAIILIDLTNLHEVVMGFELPQRLEHMNYVYWVIENHANSMGVILVKTVGQYMMFGCESEGGNLNHIHKSIDFAHQLVLQCQSIVHMDVSLQLNIRVCISCGDCWTGFTGKSRFSFDVWGLAHSEAFSMISSTPIQKIQVTRAILERIKPYSRYIVESCGSREKTQHFVWLVNDIWAAFIEKEGWLDPGPEDAA